MLSQKYNVKLASIEDLDKLAELFDLYRVFYSQQSNSSGAKQFLAERMDKNESVIFIVEENDQNEYVGFTQLYPSFSSVSMQRSWILNDLYVKDEHRGNGIARLLLEKAEGLVKETAAKGLALSTATDNERAQKIYEDFGFIKDEAFFHYYKRV